MGSRFLFSRTLRSSSTRAWYRIAGVGGACLVLLGAWAFYVHAEARRQALADAERSAAVVAHAVARDEERLLDSAQQVLLGLARRPEIL